MDWDSFWGSNLPSTGIDPYEPTTEQRRRILAQSLSSLGSGMVKAALSPTWGQFGLNFSQGLGAMNDVQQSEYERQMKLNQGNALFKKNMEQEDQQSELNKLNIKHAQLQSSHEDEDEQIRQDLIRNTPAIVGTLYETTKSILDTAQVDPSQQAQLDLMRKQLEVQKGLALRDPEKYLEKFNTFAMAAATMAGKQKELEESLDEAAQKHAAETGWVHLDDNGNFVGADLEGMQKWGETQRDLTKRSTEANIDYTRANTEYRDRYTPGGSNDQTKGQVKFSMDNVNKEIATIQKEISDLKKWTIEDGPAKGRLDVSIPNAAILAKRIGIPLTPDKDNTVAIPKSVLDQIDAMDDMDAMTDVAIRRLTAKANKMNSAMGKPALGSKPGEATAEPGAAPGSTKTEVKAPTKEAVQRKIEKFGLAKVISELKKIPGMTPEKIKELYGI